MKQYLRLANKVISTGLKKENRTKIDHIGYQGDMCQYNMEDGFPVVTTKKLAWKSAIAEMLSFLRGHDNVADFRKLGCKVWDQNANENKEWLANPNRKGDGDLGKVYRWRSNSYIRENITIRKDPPKKNLAYNCGNVISPDFSSNKHGIVGEKFSSNNHGDFIVIKEVGPGELKYNIQFVLTNYVKNNCKKAEILSGEIKDIYFPICQGVGAIGDMDKFNGVYTKDFIKHMKDVWYNMIERCYEQNETRSKWHKGKGVFVSENWLIFENFLSDFKKLPNWELKMIFPKEYSLDKDMFNSNYYSVETCRWCTKKEQSINSNKTASFIATNLKTQQKVPWVGAKSFVEKYGVPANFCNVIGKLSVGESMEYHGWDFLRTESSEICYTEIDQLKIIVAKLKLGIDDRRLIVSSWQVNILDQMSLPPCHMLFKFGIHGSKLNLSMYQRSCDVPLGVPFNVVGYSWLLMVISKITGYKPGTFTHFMDDIHIYENQINLMKEQVKRKPKKLPKLKINPKIKSLEDLETWVTTDDFELEGYNPHPMISYPFAL